MGSGHGKEFSSVDLIEQAKNHHDLIQELIFNPIFFHPNTVQQAIERYEKYWIPFASKHWQYQQLIAPLDIELVWIAHMHNPTAYANDCLKLTGKARNYDFTLNQPFFINKGTRNFRTFPDFRKFCTKQCYFWNFFLEVNFNYQY